jgi:hypothetical protein
MSNETRDDEFPVGERLTPQDEADVSWYDAATAGSADTLNTSLQQLITVSAALFGLAAAFFDSAKVPPWSRTVGCVLLLATLAVSIFGTLPLTFKLPLLLEPIRDARARLFRSKLWCHYAAVALLFLALAVFLLGILFGDGPKW